MAVAGFGLATFLLGCKSHLGQLGCKSESENRIFILLTPSAKVPRLARGCYAVDKVFDFLNISMLLIQICCDLDSIKCGRNRDEGRNKRNRRIG